VRRLVRVRGHVPMRLSAIRTGRFGVTPKGKRFTNICTYRGAGRRISTPYKESRVIGLDGTECAHRKAMRRFRMWDRYHDEHPGGKH
jgi:hypothetical protein